MTCEYRKIKDGVDSCLISEQWGQLPVAPVTDAACKVCLSLKESKTVNRVTVSLAVSEARHHSKEKMIDLLNQGKQYLSDPTLTEKVVRYASSTENWIKAGSPVRTDEEVETILKICQSNECKQFQPHNDGQTGVCRVCGCELNKMGGLVNKIRRATESCPLGKW